jgi:hypothetical protein
MIGNVSRIKYPLDRLLNENRDMEAAPKHSKMRIAALTVCFALCSTALGQSQDNAANLAQIAARGRALFAYDAAAAAATDAVKAASGAAVPPGQGLYIGHPDQNGAWVFDFGTISPDRAAFSTYFRAAETAPHTAKFAVTKLAPPEAGTPFDLAAARAAMAAQDDFGKVTRPYNYAILPLQNGDMYVYMYPAQTDPKIHPLGGDERYLVSADGKTILEKHRMHQRIIEMPADAPAGSTMQAGFHSDIFSGTPEDTDVFHVLIRRPLVEEFVVAQGEVYLIQTDGTIVDKGKRP